MADRGERGRFQPGHNLPGPGRKSLYDEGFREIALRLALLGLTDEQMAKAFGISTETFYAWQREHDGFSEAVNSGQVLADGNVAPGLYQRAVGMTVTSERAFKSKEGEVVVAQTKTQLPPDPSAAMNWLANRQRSLWGKPDAVTPPNEPQRVSNMSDEDRAAKIAEYERRREHAKKDD